MIAISTCFLRDSRTGDRIISWGCSADPTDNGVPMPVVYHCPHCRQPVTVPDQMLGQVLGCPHCRGAFQTFPAQPPVAAPPPPPPPPTPAEVFSLDDADPNEDDEDDRPRRKRYQPASRYKRDQQKVPLSTQI